MAAEKNNRIKSILLLGVIASLVLATSAAGRNTDWTNYTSFKSIRKMVPIDDTLYVATSGGILAITDVQTAGQEYTNLEGLGTNDITDIIKDASGQKWVAGFGRLIKFSDESSRQYLFFDIDDNLFRLRRVVDDGDNLWVGTDLGLVLFSKTIDDGQIQDSYQLFDDLNPSPAVFDILLVGDSIWVATSAGLAVADRSNPSLLKSPSSWTGFDISGYPELRSDSIINVVRYESGMYVATPRGVHQLQADVDTSFASVALGDAVTVYGIKLERDSLFIYYRNSAGGHIDYYSGGSGLVNLSTAGLPSPAITGVANGATRWVAVSDGIYENHTGVYLEYPYTGIPANEISDITVNRDGIVSAGFRVVSFASYIDSVWDEYGIWVRGGTTLLMTDSSDYLWMGTIGNGLWFYDGDTLKNYDENNSTMRGNIDNPPNGQTYVIITGLVTDGNFLYASCYRALNDYPVVFCDIDDVDNPSAWDSIGVGNGLNDIYVGSLDLYNGRLAVATEGNGVYICDVGDDPSGANITCQHLTRENSLLISNSTQTLKYSPDGVLWVGTTFGLSRYDAGIDRFVDVTLPAEVSSNITSLEFDGRGNLWVGTIDGLVTLDAITGEFEVYNTLNSEIVADVINSITYDWFTGDIYIATSSGFSYVPSDIGQPVFDVEQVLAFPNPFVIDDAADRLNFNYGADGRVRIFNAAGELVRQTSVNLPWDGKNDRGKDVASGVYVFVITDDEGKVGKGKFLLVRK
ncbi:MAG: two-component regulator propeller domain-containing protein [Candidatus Zixiibacteriota bacterium]